METDGDEEALFWQYEGDEADVIIKELLEKFLATAFN